jgi:hypothetical protein
VEVLACSWISSPALLSTSSAAISCNSFCMMLFYSFCCGRFLHER